LWTVVAPQCANTFCRPLHTHHFLSLVRPPIVWGSFDCFTSAVNSWLFKWKATASSCLDPCWGCLQISNLRSTYHVTCGCVIPVCFPIFYEVSSALNWHMPLQRRAREIPGKTQENPRECVGGNLFGCSLVWRECMDIRGQACTCIHAMLGIPGWKDPIGQILSVIKFT
jgi:hypothetical protein